MTTDHLPQSRTRVVAYGRVSTAAQAENQISIESQMVAIRLRAQTHGFEVVKEYVDEGYSGTTDKRPDLKRMMGDVLSGELQVSEVWVYSYSRFFREPYLQEHYIRQLEQAGIKFVAISEDYGEDEDVKQSMRQFSGTLTACRARRTRAM